MSPGCDSGQRLYVGSDRAIELVEVGGTGIDFEAAEEMPLLREREGLAGPDDAAGPKKLDFLEGSFDIDFGVDAVVGVGGAVLVGEAFDEKLVAEEMGDPSFFVAEADFLGVGAGGVGAEKDVFEAEGEARILQVSEGAEGEGLGDGRVVVVGLERDAGDDASARGDDGDGPDGDVDGPEGVAGDGVVELDFGAGGGEGDAELLFNGSAVGGRVESEAEVAVGFVLDGEIIGRVGGGEELGPDPEAMAAVGFPGAEGGFDGTVGEAAEMILAAGGAIEEDARTDGGADDEVGGSVGELKAAGETGEGERFDCHAVGLDFVTNDVRRMTKEHCMGTASSR